MKTLSALLLAGLGLNACAGISPPSASEMAALPVLTYGQPAPAGQDFVLHYPAGTPLPVQATVTGSLLAREDKADLQVSLKRDVYVYKGWVSFDGKNWQRSQELVTGKITATIPGEADGRNPGTLAAEFNLK